MLKKILLVVAMLTACLGATSQAATEHDHHSHHGGEPAKLTLNNGQKWATDASTRQGMAAIRDALAAKLPAIHSGKMSSRQYSALAQKVNDQIAFMVRNCKLDKETDATLHLVLTQLIDGTDAMSGKKDSKARHQGAEKMIHTLDDYAAHFDHPGWQGINGK